jgi:hypothetical protein
MGLLSSIFGGGGSSTAQTSSQTTNQTDNRIVAGDGASTFSNSSGNSLTSDSHNITNYTTTDYGSIQGSMALIASGQRESAGVANHALDTGRAFFDSGLGFADHALEGVLTNSDALMRTTAQVLNGQANTQATATAAIKDAFSTAKSGEQKIMVGAALAIVAIVAMRK